MSAQDPDLETGTAGEDDPMDARDLAILTDVLGLYEAFDPAPDMLPDLVLFALAAPDLDAELARLVDSELVQAAGTGARAVEQARRVTFSSPQLTVAISVSEGDGGAVRVDGWCAPGGGLHVELRCGDTLFTTVCDPSGRFAFPGVPGGMAQFTLLPTADSDPAVTTPVATPAIHL